MTRSTPTRRTTLKAVGAATAVAVAGGCLSDGDDGNGTENGADGIEIDPGMTITLEGQTSGWKGLEPAAIEGETNPTLVLREGETYELGWEQGDGSRHNLEIRDADERMVDEYGTEVTDDPDEVLEFTATDEMAYYRCNPHSSMQGEIRVE